jgi:hypothetical protein
MTEIVPVVVELWGLQGPGHTQGYIHCRLPQVWLVCSHPHNSATMAAVGSSKVQTLGVPQPYFCAKYGLHSCPGAEVVLPTAAHCSPQGILGIHGPLNLLWLQSYDHLG